MMQSKHTGISVLFALLFGLAISGCEQEGPAERAGEQIDKTVEKTGEAAESAGDRAQESTDR